MQRATPRKFPDSASTSSRRAGVAMRSAVSLSFARSRRASSCWPGLAPRAATPSSSVRSSRQRARISSNSASFESPRRVYGSEGALRARVRSRSTAGSPSPDDGSGGQAAEPPRHRLAEGRWRLEELERHAGGKAPGAGLELGHLAHHLGRGERPPTGTSSDTCTRVKSAGSGSGTQAYTPARERSRRSTAREAPSMSSVPRKVAGAGAGLDGAGACVTCGVGTRGAGAADGCGPRRREQARCWRRCGRARARARPGTSRRPGSGPRDAWPAHRGWPRTRPRSPGDSARGAGRAACRGGRAARR